MKARTQAFLWQLIRPYRWPLLGGSLLMVVSAGAMLALPQYLKHMFDAALRTGDTTQLATLAAYMFGTVLIMVTSIFLRSRLIAFSSNALLASLRNRLTAQLLGQDAAYFETRSSGEIVSRLSSDTFALREFLTVAAPQLVRGVFLGVGTLGVLLYTSPSLTLILLAAGAPIVLAGMVLGEKIRITARSQQDNVAAYGAKIEEVATNIRTVMAFNQQLRLLEEFTASTDEISRLGNYRAFLGAAFVATNVVIGFTALIAVVWLGGLRVMAGTMTLGDMMAFLLYLAFLADAAGGITNFWPGWQATLGATERIIEMLNHHPAITSPANPKTLPPAKKGRAIVLKNLTYAYPARPEVPALHNLNLTIKPGSNIAIVGPSGAGKSTLFRLLLRLDDPTSGRPQGDPPKHKGEAGAKVGSILLDGVDIKSLSLGHLRTQFALVAQESPLFSGTVAHNAAFGKPDATADEIRAALKAANADAFVEKLPKKIHTTVGEKGVQLSGGQKQRLAIARAILAGAPILLLDEATSHLDSESEQAIQKSLATLTKNKTTLTIAHRLSTVKSADLILVLNHGRIEATGTHAELLKSSPLYKALATLQLQS